MDEDGGRVPADPVSGAGPDWPGGALGGHGLQLGSDVNCWVRPRQLRKPGWHDLTMGYLCPAPPQRPVRKTEGLKVPWERHNFLQ